MGLANEMCSITSICVCYVQQPTLIKNEAHAMSMYCLSLWLWWVGIENRRCQNAQWSVRHASHIALLSDAHNHNYWNLLQVWHKHICMCVWWGTHTASKTRRCGAKRCILWPMQRVREREASVGRLSAPMPPSPPFSLTFSPAGLLTNYLYMCAIYMMFSLATGIPTRQILSLQHFYIFRVWWRRRI